MAQPGYSQPSPPTTDNPIVAVGRKVKSTLSSHQQPSIRILRESSSAGKSRHVAAPQGDADKYGPHGRTQGSESRAELGEPSTARAATSSAPSTENTFSSRFAGMRSRFGHPEVSTLNTLTNVQNSLFVPQLGKLVNRRPVYRISEDAEKTRTIDKIKNLLKNIKSRVKGEDEKRNEAILSNAQYAILPDGEKLEGWNQEEKEELDDMVRHMLHSRRAKFKRSMKGFGQYVRRPFGLFITVYATLITLFGAAWVLFLIGWISLGSKEDYVVNVVDNVLVALFAIIGDGLAPFRAVDTYHMIYIAYYHRKTWKRREEFGLPELVDHNDLPEQRKENAKPEVDLESLVARKMPRGMARKIAPRIPKKYAQRIVSRGNTKDPSYEYSVLTEEQQAKLEYHERKFSKSHTFYKPHETETHYAFPLKLLVAVVLLLDLHSCLQITLGACTWGINYHKRPFALTTVVLCCSITCNIMGGVLISVGDKRTRKKDVVERMMRQELTSEAIEQIRDRQLKEAEKRGEIHPSVRKRMEEEREEAENEEIKKSWKSVPSLPKKLLGKGEDHRQPSLPQEARRSSSTVAVDSKSSIPRKPVSRGSAPMQSVQEGKALPSYPKPALKRGEEPPKERAGQRVMKFIRRADLDRS
ncbi:related to ahmp1 protein [Phialocephala subalpina]|uniref:Related to ahmp1 protein n=1 Tax=Phialocephala subalpina TaxID=576137 RepID=A0A1L7X965_9HELO|nr:related to ahmp1 protein [Phialocephala subalpina]